LDFKRIGVTTLTFRGHVTSSVTMMMIPHYRPFPIGGLLEPSVYLYIINGFWDIQRRM